MTNAKEQVRRILDQLPEDSSLEDIQYHIYVREKIERGLREIDEGKLLSAVLQKFGDVFFRMIKPLLTERFDGHPVWTSI